MLKMIIGLSIVTSAFAQTLHIKEGDVFTGQETYNHAPTGQECSVKILSITANEKKGIHCSNVKVEYSFKTKLDKLPKNIQTVYSVTSKIKNTERSCASLVDSNDNEDMVFEQNTSGLYNRLFGSESGGMWNKNHFFMTFDTNKLPLEAKIVNIKPMMEREWVCNFQI